MHLDYFVAPTILRVQSTFRQHHGHQHVQRDLGFRASLLPPTQDHGDLLLQEVGSGSKETLKVKRIKFRMRSATLHLALRTTTGT